MDASIGSASASCSMNSARFRSVWRISGGLDVDLKATCNAIQKVRVRVRVRVNGRGCYAGAEGSHAPGIGVCVVCVRRVFLPGDLPRGCFCWLA